MPEIDPSPKDLSRRPTVAVVGAGFSGVMTALHLLRAPDGPRVMLFDRKIPFARGAAYSTGNPDHLLNVRAGNMSAWPDQPLHFANWLAKVRGTEPDPATFATRGDYGRYLQDLLAHAAEAASAVGRLVIVPDDVVDAVRDGQGWRIELGVGRHRHVNALVLAIGNSPPATPVGVDADLIASGLYVADPWSWNGEATDTDADAPILLIGTGLTMVDVALACSRAVPGRKLVALSRRGLQPNAHRGPPPQNLPRAPQGLSPLLLMQWLRRTAKDIGWRAAVDSLRPDTQSIWSRWSQRQRAQFQRHARPYWDVHRHRLAPVIAERIRDLTESGTLSIVAGRILSLTASAGEVVCRWAPRGVGAVHVQTFSRAVACTGPQTDLQDLRDPLLVSLRRQGLIRADAMKLGVDCTPTGRLIGESGDVTPGLYGLGPITRGALWEIVAVPDIRQQAPVIAAEVMSGLLKSGA